MTTRKGSCLCGTCAFEIDGDIDGVGVCHCSLCRKVSGANGMTIIRLPAERFRWLKGEDNQSRFELRKTYSVTRCKTCGSTLPVSYDGGENIWINAGLMDDPLGKGIEMHIFCASRADWDFEAETAVSFDEYPG